MLDGFRIHEYPGEVEAIEPVARHGERKRAIAARTSASVGAPFAGARVSVAGPVGRGSGVAIAGFSNGVEAVVGEPPSPATGLIACGCAWGSAVEVATGCCVAVCGREADPHPAATTAAIVTTSRSLIRQR